MALGYENTFNGMYKGGKGAGGYTGTSSIGGVSAVNPQSSQNVQGFIDDAYNSARMRMKPRFAEQAGGFEQQMANQGIAAGSDAYQKAKAGMLGSQNDAYQQAAYGANREGLFAQNQDFQQDATRSQLANSLLQSKWNVDLGQRSLNEQGRQYDNTLGYQYDAMDQRGYEFDQQLDKSYYDTDSQYDYMYDRADQDDYRFGYNADRQSYLDDLSAQHYDDAFMMQLLGMGGTPGVYTQDPTSAYNAQLGYMGQARGQNMNMMGEMMSTGAMASDARLKDNLTKVGEINGINIYTWVWNKIAEKMGLIGNAMGVVAQEHSAFTVTMPNGYLAVLYGDLFGDLYGEEA
jgi:hypothetical protein